MELYTAIVVITMALLVVNIVDVYTDRLADKTATIRFITVCVVIGLAQMGEWIGVKTNGAELALIGPHWFAKTVEFCMAPVMCVMAAHTYGKVEKACGRYWSHCSECTVHDREQPVRMGLLY